MIQSKCTVALISSDLSQSISQPEPSSPKTSPFIADDRSAPTQVLLQEQCTHLLIQTRHDPLDVPPTLIKPGPDPQLVLRVSGFSQMALTANGTTRRYKPRPGDLFLTPPGQEPYELQRSRLSDQLVRTIHLYLRHRLLAQTAAELVGTDAAQVELQNKSCFADPLLHQLASSLGQALEQPAAGSNLFAETAAQLVAIQLLRQHSTTQHRIPERLGKLAPERLRQLHEYIVNHLDQPITLDSLAAIACMSAYHFCRVFKRTTGKSPNQYVIDLRLKQAQELLRTGCPVALAAQAVGYPNAHYFARLFHRHIGYPPSQWRLLPL